MKLHLLLTGLTILMTASLAPLHAQTAAPTSTQLSPADRQHLMSVRQQVLAANPDLKAEQESLKQERQALKGQGQDSAARATFMQHLQDHMAKMKTAMIKVDLTVAPLIDQAEANTKARMAQHAGKGEMGGF